MRKIVAVFFISNTDFDEYACKYIILNLNAQQFQSCFEFEFPEIVEITNKHFPKKDYCELPDLFNRLSTCVELAQKNCSFKADYFIGITNIGMSKEEDLFWATQDNKAIITTNQWEKVFSPPSVFEYILNSLTGSLTIMVSRVQGTHQINEHIETRGCYLDYASKKKDNRVDVSLGYVCENCRSEIKESLGNKYVTCFENMCSRKWLGEVSDKGSPAYNLKKFFRVDLDKDTGFYKTFREKVRDSLPDLPKESVLVFLAALFSALFTYFLTR